MKKILVTGGLGYIGSHTVVLLQKSGYEVYIIDDLSNCTIKVLDKIMSISNIRPHFFQIDLNNKSEVFNFFEENIIHGVIHFASFKAVGESVLEPLAYYRNNIDGLLNILDAMLKYEIDHFIFSSSCSVYGQVDVMPITESTPLNRPESPYGKTKAIGEEILHDFTFVTKKNAISLRYFNPVGAHESTLIGDAPNGIPNNLIPYITQTAKGILKELTVYGDDYDTRDGTAIRDYIDVNDLAEAHLLALQYLLDKKNTDYLEFFNLGSGKGSTVLEIINAFESVNNIKIPYKISNRRIGDIQEAYADYTKAKVVLGWKPKRTLETSMKAAWEFQKSFVN